ncbi:MAG: sialidase family protein [Hymenobacter sp.]
MKAPTRAKPGSTSPTWPTLPPGMCCSGLFEMPAAGGATPAGALLWATSIGTDQGGRGPCSIRLHRSLDGGRSWQYYSTPVSGYIGLWEPEFILDGQGRLVVYYSSEEHKAEGYNQLLAHKVSTDGGLTWGAETVDVGKADGHQRPGMAIVRCLAGRQLRDELRNLRAGLRRLPAHLVRRRALG